MTDIKHNQSTKNSKDMKDQRIFRLSTIVYLFRYQLIGIMILCIFHEISYIFNPYFISKLYGAIENYYKNHGTLREAYLINMKNVIYWILITIFGSICKIYSEIIFNKIELKVKSLSFSYFHNLSYEDFLTIQGEDAFNYLKALEFNIREIISIFIIHIFANLWTIIINIFILAYMLPKLVFTVFIWASIHVIFTHLTLRKNTKYAKTIFLINKKMMNNILESFLSILMIKVTNTKNYELEKLNNQMGEYSKKSSHFIINSEILQICSGIIGDLLLWGMGVYIILQTIQFKPISIAHVTYLIMVIYGISRKIKNISTMFTRFIETINEYKQNIAALDIYKLPYYTEKSIHYDPNTFAVKMTNVSFTLNNISILQNVSLEIKQGEKVCFIGRSGAGKSTIINLLNGIYKKYSGEIQLYGQDTKDINMENIIEHFSIINQSSMLLNRTVRENLIQNRDIPYEIIVY